MKFYNVFSGFLSGSSRDAYLKNIGDRKFNSLHSYWYLKDLPDEKIIEGFSITKGNIMIDSGAFTAWTKDINIDVDAYIDWINKWNDRVITFGQIDVIPPKTANLQQIDECCKRTWQNYIYMTDRVVCPEKILYTFHYGEPFRWLEQALEYTLPNGNKMEYMAFGGLVGRTTKQRTEFLNECFKIVANSSNPNIKIHGFGVSSKNMWSKYPFESCDSFTPGMNANHGFTYDEHGSYREDDYKRLFKPEAPKEIKFGLFEDLVVTQNENYIPESEKSEEQLKEESAYRVDEKAKILISNIEYWDKLANNTPKPDINIFKGKKSTFDILNEMNNQA